MVVIEQYPKVNNEPVSFRLPRSGSVDLYFGFTRTAWNELILPTPRNRWNPPVKSRVFRQPGAARGIRLIDFQSAKAFYNDLEVQSGKEVSA